MTLLLPSPLHHSHHSFPLPLLLLLLLLLLSFPPCLFSQPTPLPESVVDIREDGEGNLHVNTTANGQSKVFVNGIDVAAQSILLTSLQQSLASTLAEISALKASFARTFPFDRVYAVGGLIVENGAVVYLDSIAHVDSKAGALGGPGGPNHVWGAGSPLLQARGFAPTVVYGPHLYVLGGLNTAGALASVERYDGRYWTPTPNLSVGRYGHAAAVYSISNSIKTAIYVFGGYTAGPAAAASVERFDGTAWATAPAMLTGRCYLGGAVYKGGLYAIGGYSATTAPQYYQTVEVFMGSAWASAPAMAFRRHAIATAVYQDALYVMGGHDGTNILSAVERYTGGAAWAVLPQALVIGRAFHSTVVVNNLLHVLGGGTAAGAEASTESFNGTHWALGLPMDTPRSTLGVSFF